MAGDQVWLRNSLAKALGWDEQVAEGVVDALAAAQSQEEVDELVQACQACLSTAPKTLSEDVISSCTVSDYHLLSGLPRRQC